MKGWNSVGKSSGLKRGGMESLGWVGGGCDTKHEDQLTYYRVVCGNCV